MKRLLLLIIIIQQSCTSNNIEQDFKRITKDPINIEAQHYIKYFNRNFASCNLPKHDACLLIVYDSTNCSNCRINSLIDFDDIFLIAKNTNNRFLPIILFAPRIGQYNELVRHIELLRYEHPVYIDKQNLFYRDNPSLLNFRQYNAFLLDKNNKIILIGNPIDNEQMWTLFRSTLDNMLAHDGEYVPE